MRLQRLLISLSLLRVPCAQGASSFSMQETIETPVAFFAQGNQYTLKKPQERLRK
jgi:hypothetical protein